MAAFFAEAPKPQFHIIPAPPEPPQPVYKPQAVQSTYVAPAPVITPLNASDDYYKLYIYTHESGNNPARWNSEGCVGLGQACPAAKLLLVCPLLDYGCEDAWFSNYALRRYGSWLGAYNYWLAHHNW